MPISVVFDPPLPSDSPSTFNTKAFTLLGDLNDWSTQANALPGEVATNLSALLAAPPAIGSTTPAAGSFTTLSASGNAAIGAASGSERLLVADTGNPSVYIKFQNNAAASGFVGYNSSGAIEVLTGGTKRVEVSSSGLAVTGALSASTGTDGISVGPGTGTSTRANIKFQGTDAVGVPVPWVVGSNIVSTDGSLDFYNGGLRSCLSTTGLAVTGALSATGNLGLGVTPSAWSGVKALQLAGSSVIASDNQYLDIVANAYYNGVYRYIRTAAATDYAQENGSHVWKTAPSGTAGNPISFTQAMTLTAGGRLTVNASTSAPSGCHTLQDNAASPNNLRVYNDTDSNTTTNRFLICDAGASVLRAEIRSNGGLANFSANNVNLSDVRTKKNIQDAGNYLAKICAIPVRTFLYKDQTDNHLNLGAIAQEVEAQCPELVSNDGFGDTPADGVPLKSIYQTDMQYALMKCIQEQQALIESLAARVAQLEG